MNVYVHLYTLMVPSDLIFLDFFKLIRNFCISRQLFLFMLNRSASESPCDLYLLIHCGNVPMSIQLICVCLCRCSCFQFSFSIALFLSVHYCAFTVIFKPVNIDVLVHLSSFCQIFQQTLLPIRYICHVEPWKPIPVMCKHK